MQLIQWCSGIWNPGRNEETHLQKTDPCQAWCGLQKSPLLHTSHCVCRQAQVSPTVADLWALTNFDEISALLYSAASMRQFLQSPSWQPHGKQIQMKITQLISRKLAVALLLHHWALYWDLMKHERWACETNQIKISGTRLVLDRPSSKSGTCSSSTEPGHPLVCSPGAGFLIGQGTADTHQWKTTAAALLPQFDRQFAS